MVKTPKESIGEVLDDLNGLAFKNAKPYTKEDKIFFVNRYSQTVTFAKGITKDSVVLEIGLAGGELAFSLKKYYSLDKVYALEHPTTSKKYSDNFLNKLKENNISLTFVDLREGKLPWKDNFFDFVFICDVIEHLIPSDIPKVMKEINRVLKKKGTLVLVTPNVASFLKRINLLRGKNPVEFDLRLHEGATFGHIREYTMNELEEIASNSGFGIENKKYFMIDVERNIFTRIEDLVSKAIPQFANSLAIILKK